MCCDGSPQPYKKRKFVHILSDSPSSSSSSSPLSQFLHPSNDHITSTNPSVSGGHISKSQHVFDTDSEQASDVMDIEEPTIETSSIHGDHRFPTARSDCVGDESSNVEAENDRHDSRSCTQEIAAMDRRVRRWANDLDYIYTQRHSIVRDAAREAVSDVVEIRSSRILMANKRASQQLIQADELLGILRDIDDNKHWITKAEATQSRLAGKVRNMLKTIDRELEMESKKVARRILDDFAQRFMGERYPRRS
ncbi:hypothetical protein BJ138DRAFT_1139109 [Hygrophoropsis aurantiaca]|uniref:Uncharacterized protein n=1 Tax=Hygrophoropsis aurantiaca TaxID=72124 RepID=A0ACB8AVF1_9AGAM|nr:hypothetical protein BJ138DRAFT_1139109 [Hygrophoropsis aurantiaca]